MDLDEDDRKDVERRKAVVDQLEKLIRDSVSRETDVIEQPAIIAALVDRFGHSPRDFSSMTLENVIGGCVGRAIGDETPRLLELAERIHAGGYTEENKYDFGYADRYAFSLKNTEKQKVFALRTQNVNYLVILVKNWRGWDVHIRQWWDVLSEKSYVPYDLKPLMSGKLLTFEEAQRISGRFEDYADDIPGMSYPKRLSLKAFQDTDFRVHKDNSCAGLRYADARDTGYIITVKRSVFNIYEADKVTWKSLSLVQYVWYDLLSAIDTLDREDEDK